MPFTTCITLHSRYVRHFASLLLLAVGIIKFWHIVNARTIVRVQHWGAVKPLQMHTLICPVTCLFNSSHSGADPENCFGRGTLDLSCRRHRGGKVWGGLLPLSQPTRWFGDRRRRVVKIWPARIFRWPWVWRGHVPPVPPVWIRPWSHYIIHKVQKLNSSKQLSVTKNEP